MDDSRGNTGHSRESESYRSSGLPQASMQAIISADSSMKQAQVQASVATKMNGRAGVLESEIKLDARRGVSTERKEAELADVEEKAQDAVSSQISTLADANEVMKEASKEDQSTSATEISQQETGLEYGEAGTVSQNSSVVTTDTTSVTAAAPQPVNYTPVDIRV